jgi:hypothetical protein
VICGCVAVGLPALAPTQPGITRENFERVQIGMKKADVEAILGGEGKTVPEYEVRRGSTIEWSAKDGFRVSVDFLDDRVSEKTSWNHNIVL